MRSESCVTRVELHIQLNNVCIAYWLFVGEHSAYTSNLYLLLLWLLLYASVVHFSFLEIHRTLSDYTFCSILNKCSHYIWLKNRYKYRRVIATLSMNFDSETSEADPGPFSSAHTAEDSILQSTLTARNPSGNYSLMSIGRVVEDSNTSSISSAPLSTIPLPISSMRFDSCLQCLVSYYSNIYHNRSTYNSSRPLDPNGRRRRLPIHGASREPIHPNNTSTSDSSISRTAAVHSQDHSLERLRRILRHNTSLPPVFYRDYPGSDTARLNYLRELTGTSVISPRTSRWGANSNGNNGHDGNDSERNFFDEIDPTRDIANIFDSFSPSFTSSSINRRIGLRRRNTILRRDNTYLENSAKRRKKVETTSDDWAEKPWLLDLKMIYCDGGWHGDDYLPEKYV